MGLARAGDLSGGVHCERAGTLEPELVTRSLEECEECVAVAGGAVTETGFLGERAGDRRLDRARVPGLLEERLVALGIEESQR
jgi:hypothetical protein